MRHGARASTRHVASAIHELGPGVKYLVGNSTTATARLGGKT